MIIDAINNSFLLSSSQKIYLIEKLETCNESFKRKLEDNLNSENEFMLQLLKKYKQDSNNTSIWQLKWELMQKNFKKIRELEESDNDDFLDLEKNLESI